MDPNIIFSANVISGLKIYKTTREGSEGRLRSKVMPVIETTYMMYYTLMWTVLQGRCHTPFCACH